MSPIVPLRIDAALAGRETEFEAAMAERSVREQHWAGRAGKGGLSLREIMMERGGDMCDRLMAQGLGESDFRYAASRFEATGDPDLRELAAHVRAFEMYAAEQAEERMAREMGTIESRTMTEFLREAGVPVRADQGRRWTSDNAGQMHEPQAGPRTTAPLGFPTQTTAEPMSGRLRALAGQVRRLAGLASSARQRNRLAARAQELERMAVRSYEREGAVNDEDVYPSRNDGDEFSSFDSWSDPDEPRYGSDDASLADVDAQKRAAADDLALDEDLPHVPRAGSRFDEDENPGHGDEPAGLRRNKFDNYTGHVRKGPARFGSGQPRGNDRYGGERSRYSAFKRESMRESGDLTATLLNDLDLWYRSGLSWY